ncbi:hypothetical protein PPO43_14445 [Saprospira sp. CCB-QB6]|uniref:hypothetical protein n=1 Tax=Saprospira sp. CCB-QB6 TaxID=3023936 RepID=UPI002349F37A|nr:hypothetical protein [Saprospira sp. CCB-QB6]WCL81171.1 hypothetical protein PPO43_14445 [Saprospira sp. CCB-QB6]
MKESKVCCDSMLSFLSDELDKGFYVKKREHYKIGFNVIPLEQKSAFFKIIGGTIVKQKFLDEKILNASFGGEIGIKYCPWCGSELK